MSSNLRSPSQIGVHSKFLIGISETIDCGSGGTAEGLFGNAGTSIVQTTAGSLLPLGSRATIDEIDALMNAGGVSFINGTLFNCVGETTSYNFMGRLFKDLGRQLTIYDSTLPGSPHISTYRECQLVGGINYNAADTEGVATDLYPTTPQTYQATFWIRVWAADGTGVAVARLG